MLWLLLIDICLWLLKVVVFLFLLKLWIFMWLVWLFRCWVVKLGRCVIDFVIDEFGSLLIFFVEIDLIILGVKCLVLIDFIILLWKFFILIILMLLFFVFWFFFVVYVIKLFKFVVVKVRVNIFGLNIDMMFFLLFKL